MSCQFLPKLSIRLLPIFTQFIHKYSIRFEKKSRILLKKPKLLFILTSIINQYEYVYALLKMLFYGIEDPMTRIINLEMY
jgi:hypothetical protein